MTISTRAQQARTSDQRPPARSISKVSEPMEHKTVLLAEDDHDLRTFIAEELRAAGFEVVECINGTELAEYLLRSLESDEPVALRAIVSDIRMPGATGLTALAGLRDLGHDTPFIVMTAFGSDEVHEQAFHLGATAVFDKPFDADDLIAKVTDLTGPCSAAAL